MPSLRAESFHNALYGSIGLAGKAATAERMLGRLGTAISAELTAIESIERRADDHRRVRYAVAVGFVSAVAIPASLILAFLGINASQVNSDRSMFSTHYLGMYVAVAALIVIGCRIVAGPVDAAPPRCPPPAGQHVTAPLDGRAGATSFITELPGPASCHVNAPAGTAESAHG